MEKLYTIKGNYAEILIEEDIYPLITVEKAISNFTQDVYIKLEHKDKKTLLIKIVLQEDKKNLENIIGEFYNELLRENIRYNVSKETKNLRELIVGRALYTTCIEMDEQDKEQCFESEKNNCKEASEEDYNLDEIAVNWFENNEDKEE